jgi:hypothetical protein
MCLNKKYSKVRIGKHLSDSLKLIGTHQLLAYTDEMNLLRNNVDIIKKNTETLIDVSKKVGL